jgi:guanosine-3',5'-bis(diphosphate) 3'-pyrophosphohydrolase
MTTSNEATLFSALAFAADKHRNQRRKDPEASPYINHPIALARILAAEGSVTDTVTLAAAVLHDTIEDTKTTADELRELFGDRVTNIVMEVTDDKSLLKAERKKRQVEQASFLTPQAKLLKLADKIANLRDVALRSPADWSLERRREYFDWAKQVIDGLRGVHPQLEAVFDAAYQAKP